MRVLELKFGDKIYTNAKDINDVFIKEKFYWIIDSEIENARIEIKNNTVIWHDGNYYTGNWYYGIFKNGYFYGNWENGIWEGGYFKGKWQSGINLSTDIKK